jgi:hypothetical protein
MWGAKRAIGPPTHRTLPRSAADLLASFTAEASTKDSTAMGYKHRLGARPATAVMVCASPKVSGEPVLDPSTVTANSRRPQASQHADHG